MLLATTRARLQGQSLHRISGFGAAVFLAALWAGGDARAVTETFDSSAGRFTTQVRNGVGGNSLAFSNTDNTGTAGPSSGAGEFGGTFARTGEGTPAYVADTNLGGSLTRD